MPNCNRSYDNDSGNAPRNRFELASRAPRAARVRKRARSRGFLTHGTLVIGALSGTVLTFGGALLDGSPLAAVITLLGGLTAVAVLATAWMRPVGAAPERHPRIDKLFDDTGP